MGATRTVLERVLLEGRKEGIEEKEWKKRKERKHLQFIVVPVYNPSTWTAEAEGL